MKTYHIRKAVLEDLVILREIEQAIVTYERPYDETLDVDPISYYDLHALMESPDATVLVVEHDGQIISSGYAQKKKALPYLDHEFFAYLGFMYTAEDHRGKGVNGLLIDGLKAWAIANGLSEIRLTVYDENASALKAYAKAGFKKHLVEMRLVGL